MKKIDSDTILNIIGKVFMGLCIIYGLYKGYEFFIINPAKYKTKTEADCYQTFIFVKDFTDPLNPNVNGYVTCMKGVGQEVTASNIRKQCAFQAHNRYQSDIYYGIKSGTSENEYYLSCVREEGLAN